MARGSTVGLFGLERVVDGPELAATTASSYREVLTEHFLQRHPLADAEMWDSFVRQVRAQLERSPSVDASTLTTLLMTVDGL